MQASCLDQEQLHRSIKAFSLSLSAQLLRIIARNLDKSQSHLQKIGKWFDGALKNIGNSTTLKQFKRNAQKQCMKLVERLKSPIPYHKICEEITSNQQRLVKSDKIPPNFQKWFKRNETLCKSMASHSSNKHKFENLQDLIEFLERLDIDITGQIEPQAHRYLSNPHKLSIHYGGIKKLNETLQCRGRWLEDKQVLVQLEFLFKGNQNYNKHLKMEFQTDYVGTIKVKKCACGYNNILSDPYWTNCHSCSHYPIDYPYSGTREYQIDENKNGYAEFQRRERFSQIVNLPIQTEYQTKIPIQRSIQYLQKQIVECTDHHSCSCQMLAQFLWSTKEVYQESQIYYEITKSQQVLLKQMGCEKIESQQERKTLGQIGKQFQRFGLNRESESSVSATAKKIHTLLCQDFSFNKTITNKKMVKIEQPFQHNKHIKQKIEIPVELRHRSDICYSEDYMYGGNLKYAGNVRRKICLQDCRYCHINYSDEPYEGRLQVSEEGVYFGKVPYELTKSQANKAEIDQSVRIKDVAERQLVADVVHDCNITCRKDDKIGTGHHSCSSCQLWAKFVANLKDFLSTKEALIRQITENMHLLTSLSEKLQ